MILGTVLLAAGASSRMGRPKLLLPWGSRTVIAQLIEQWQRLQSAQIAVVCAPGNNALIEELDRLAFPTHARIINPAPERGMFHSIKCASEWTGWSPTISHIALALGDQPHLSHLLLKTLLEFARAHPRAICQPSRNGRPRHPIVFPKCEFDKLAWCEVETLKQYLNREPGCLAHCEIDDPALDFDLDTPEDYAQAVQTFPIP